MSGEGYARSPRLTMHVTMEHFLGFWGYFFRGGGGLLDAERLLDGASNTQFTPQGGRLLDKRRLFESMRLLDHLRYQQFRYTGLVLITKLDHYFTVSVNHPFLGFSNNTKSP